MAQKLEWLVILNDKPGMLSERMAVRPDHIKNLGPDVKSGFWTFGGAMLEEPPKEGEALKITGSVMQGIASSKEEILEKLKNDVYAQKVWDLENVQIIPMKTAVRERL